MKNETMASRQNPLLDLSEEVKTEAMSILPEIIAPSTEKRQEEALYQAEMVIAKEDRDWVKYYQKRLDKFKVKYPATYYAIMKSRKFPREWMIKDKGIMATFARYKSLSPLMTFIFEHNQYWKPDSEEFKDMLLFQQATIGNRKYKTEKKEHILSTFFVDYDWIADKINAKPYYVRNMFLNLVKIGVYKMEGKYERIYPLYSDGFFLMKSKYVIKHSWLKKTSDFIKVLRSFTM